MRSRRRENMSKKGSTRGNLHLRIDGDRDRDPLGALDLVSKVQMRSRSRENMSKEIRTTRGASTH